MHFKIDNNAILSFQNDYRVEKSVRALSTICLPAGKLKYWNVGNNLPPQYSTISLISAGSCRHLLSFLAKESRYVQPTLFHNIMN